MNEHDKDAKAKLDLIRLHLEEARLLVVDLDSMGWTVSVQWGRREQHRTLLRVDEVSVNRPEI